MKTLKAFLELFGKMVLSLAIIISIAFAIIAIIGMLKLGNEYKKTTQIITKIESNNRNF